MKIEVTREEAAAVYIGKAVKLLETACDLLPDSCDCCPMEDKQRHICMKGELISTINRNLK